MGGGGDTTSLKGFRIALPLGFVLNTNKYSWCSKQTQEAVRSENPNVGLDSPKYYFGESRPTFLLNRLLRYRIPF